MPNRPTESELEAAGSWAKKYFLEVRALTEAVLRPFGLGTTQWYVLGRLADEGPLPQREFARALDVERATLSEVIGALVRKEFVTQEPDAHDQRQKVLTITPAGRELCAGVTDPIGLIASVAFAGVDSADVATMNRVLKEATQRLADYRKGAATS